MSTPAVSAVIRKRKASVLFLYLFCFEHVRVELILKPFKYVAKGITKLISYISSA